MKKCFTLIELILVLAILGILASVALFITYPSYDKIRFQITKNKMESLVRAIIGDERIITTGERVDFGYVGDTNRLPDTLDDLVINPGIPGWKGPYIQREFPDQDPESYKKDGWGNYFIYSKINGTITSYGSDGVPGGSGYAADITTYIYQPLEALSKNTLIVYV
ncbi:MAG: type II secretion system protein GspG, partial [Candidatus Omnitrophica bacterium]|nr:type II secretion system protein GspG [Candidatus Omnitrophota bacterium]